MKLKTENSKKKPASSWFPGRSRVVLQVLRLEATACASLQHRPPGFNIIVVFLPFPSYLFRPHGGLPTKDLLLSGRFTPSISVVLPWTVVIHNLERERT